MRLTGDQVPDIGPPGTPDGREAGVMAACPLVDEAQERYREARTAAWLGVAVAILGVLSWSEYGFSVCGGGAIVCGLYARRHAPLESWACFSAGAMLLAVLGLRLGGVL